MDNFQAIGQLVTKAQDLLDSIKGGAIRAMQNQFEALKVQFTNKLTSVSSELSTFVNQEKGKVASIFSDPDSRYQKIQPVSFTIGGDTGKFYPVVFGATAINRLTEIHIGRMIHADGTGKGAMYAKFIASGYGWGARPSTMILDTLKTRVWDGLDTDKNVVNDGFIAAYSGASKHPNGVIVWLRGGYSYEAWVDGSDLNRVDITTSQTQPVNSNNAVVYMNSYDNTVNGFHSIIDARTTRDTAIIPNFINYEKA